MLFRFDTLNKIRAAKPLLFHSQRRTTLPSDGFPHTQYKMERSIGPGPTRINTILYAHTQKRHKHDL